MKAVCPQSGDHTRVLYNIVRIISQSQALSMCTLLLHKNSPIIPFMYDCGYTPVKQLEEIQSELVVSCLFVFTPKAAAAPEFMSNDPVTKHESKHSHFVNCETMVKL